MRVFYGQNDFAESKFALADLVIQLQIFAHVGQLKTSHTFNENIGQRKRYKRRLQNVVYIFFAVIYIIRLFSVSNFREAILLLMHLLFSLVLYAVLN